jgi:hypothetical protein
MARIRGWTDKAPTEQGEYWNWNGSDDCAPVAVKVLYSRSAKSCFVAAGQLDISQAIDCSLFGGWWKRIPQPKPPTENEVRRIRRKKKGGA